MLTLLTSIRARFCHGASPPPGKANRKGTGVVRSHARHQRRNSDTPERYISGLAAVNTHHAVLALKRNKMYDVEQIGELTCVDPIQGLTKWRDKERKQMVDCWLSNVPVPVDSSPRFPVEFNPNHGTQDLLDVMKRDVVRGGYFKYITTNELFKLYALTSVYTSNEASFEALYKLDQQGQHEFQSICQ